MYIYISLCSVFNLWLCSILSLGVSAEDIVITNIVDAALPNSRRQLFSISSTSSKVSFTTAAVMESLGYSDWSILVTDLQGNITKVYADPATGTNFVNTSVDEGSETITTDNNVVFETPVFVGAPVVTVTSPSPTASPVASSGSSSSGGSEDFGSPMWVGLIVMFSILGALFIILVKKKWRRQKAEATVNVE